MLRGLFAVFIIAVPLHAQDVLTANYGNARTNADIFETRLTPSNVNAASFGKLFSLAVDGQVYAQRLYLRNVAIPEKGVHNVLFVATMHNTVYAFDADTPALPLWSVNLGPAVPAATYLGLNGPYTDISPENGILATPVIDPSTGTLYAVAATLEDGDYLYRLHALDVATGAERFGAPAVIAGTVPGIGDNSVNAAVVFDASQHIQRPGLLLANGIVYIAFGSHGDAGPYHGWVMSYSAQDVQHRMGVFNVSPNGKGGAFWQSGRGLAADDAGNVFAVSGNGTTDAVTAFSEAVLRFDPLRLTVSDWFAPANFQFLTDTDGDLGACGAILLEGTDLLLTGGKSGFLYLLRRGNLGHTAADDSQIVGRWNLGGPGIFNMAVWNRPDGPLIYTHLFDGAITAWKMTGESLSPQPVASGVNFYGPAFQGMTLSANGTADGSGVLWVTMPASYPLPAHAVLRAYDAETLNEIWNSDLSPVDSAGLFVKFTNPTVANGKVYVASASNEVEVYGLRQGDVGNPPVITGIGNAASYASDAVAPEELVVLLGQNLGPSSLAVGAFDESGKIGGGLGGTQVTFNNVPAPLVYTSAGAVAAIVPGAVSHADSVTVRLVYNGASAAPVEMPVAAAAPGIFSADATGSGPGAILNGDFSLNTPDNPAATGSVVVVYGTGGGLVNPPPSDGSIATAAAPLVADVSVTVDGKPAEVLYAGQAGGEVAGVLQVNLRLPDGVTGAAPVVLTVGGKSSPATVTVSVAPVR